jgi:hypothetical protein
VLAGGNAVVGRQRANMVVGIQLVYQWGAAAFQLIHSHHLDSEPIETNVAPEDSYHHYLHLSSTCMSNLM